MIAADNGIQTGTCPVDDPIRVWTIADKIAAAHDTVILAARRFENGVKGFPRYCADR